MLVTARINLSTLFVYLNILGLCINVSQGLREIHEVSLKFVEGVVYLAVGISICPH